jgi:hypothetical protein
MKVNDNVKGRGKWHVWQYKEKSKIAEGMCWGEDEKVISEHVVQSFLESNIRTADYKFENSENLSMFNNMQFWVILLISIVFRTETVSHWNTEGAEFELIFPPENWRQRSTWTLAVLHNYVIAFFTVVKPIQKYM